MSPAEAASTDRSGVPRKNRLEAYSTIYPRIVDGFFPAKDSGSIVFLFERLGVQKRPGKQKRKQVKL
jgi:hypothetical protein